MDALHHSSNYLTMYDISVWLMAGQVGQSNIDVLIGCVCLCVSVCVCCQC